MSDLASVSTMTVNVLSYCKEWQSYDTCKPLGVINEKLTIVPLKFSFSIVKGQ